MRVLQQFMIGQWTNRTLHVFKPLVVYFATEENLINVLANEMFLGQIMQRESFNM